MTGVVTAEKIKDGLAAPRRPPPKHSTSLARVDRVGTSQLVTRSTRHSVKWCDKLTVVSDGVVTSWQYFLT